MVSLHGLEGFRVWGIRGLELRASGLGTLSNLDAAEKQAPALQMLNLTP